VVGSPPVGFVVVSRFSVWRPPFKSAATLLCRAGSPAVLHALVLGHYAVDLIGRVISLLSKWWACSAVVAAFLAKDLYKGF